MKKLRLDWCKYHAVKYACLHWHYSKVVPAGKLVKVGVWEDEKYVGCILFGRGANHNIGKPYGLKQTECCELVRIALCIHEHPVTKMVSLAIKFLRRVSPNTKMIISYADIGEGHLGIIYQAGNWYYVGKTKGGTAQLLFSDGKTMHKRTAMSKFGTCNAEKIGAVWTGEKVKHKYIYVIDDMLRHKIELLKQSYPKRIKHSGDALDKSS